MFMFGVLVIIAGVIGVACGLEVGDRDKHPVAATFMIVVGAVCVMAGARIINDSPAGPPFVVRVSGIDDGSPVTRMVCRDTSWGIDGSRSDCRVAATPDTDGDD